MFIAVPALPIGALPPTAETSPSPWGEVAVAAKGRNAAKSHADPDDAGRSGIELPPA